MPEARITDAAPGRTALIIIDMINDLKFEGAETMRTAAEDAARAIAGLRRQAEALGVPVIYVNDNHGEWHSERSRLVEHALGEASEGRDLVDALKPEDDDFFVIKPQFSGFYATNLPVLLPRLGASRLILTGVSADICVLFTAADAHMREYELWVPADAVASMAEERTRWALEIMRESMQADIRPTTELSLEVWTAQGRSAG